METTQSLKQVITRRRLLETTILGFIREFEEDNQGLVVEDVDLIRARYVGVRSSQLINVTLQVRLERN